MATLKKIEESKTSVPAKDEVEEDEKVLCFVKDLIPIKLLFFALHASFSSLFSFLNIFYITSGLTVVQYGLITGLGSFFTLIANPLWGILVDSVKKHRILIMLFVALGTTTLEVSKPWVVIFVSKIKTVSECSQPINTSSSLFLYNTNSLDNQFVYIDNKATGQNCTDHTQLSNQKTVFYIAAVHWVICSALCAGLITFVETLVLTRISSMKQTHSYGEQKVLAPIGSALGSFLAGFAIDHYKPKTISHYLASTYIYFPISLTIPFLLYTIARQTKQADKQRIGKNAEKDKSTDEKNRASFLTVIRDHRVIFFLVTTFVHGLTSNVFGSYTYLFIFQSLNPTKTVMSLMMITSSFSNFVFLPFTGKIVNFFGGHNKTAIFALTLFGLRIIAFSFTTQVWQIFLLQLTSGLTRLLVFNILIEKTMSLFPKSSLATAIGVFITIEDTLAGIIVNVLGGYIYHHYGGVKLFRGMSFISLTWCSVMFVYYVVLGKDKLKKKDPENDVPSNDVLNNNEKTIEKETKEL